METLQAMPFALDTKALVSCLDANTVQLISRLSRVLNNIAENKGIQCTPFQDWFKPISNSDIEICASYNLFDHYTPTMRALFEIVHDYREGHIKKFIFQPKTIHLCKQHPIKVLNVDITFKDGCCLYFSGLMVEYKRG